MKTKTIILAAAVAAAAVPAHAISRYNAESMTCQQAQASVANEGAVILRYSSRSNPSLTLYDRYIAHRGYCQMGEYAKAAWIPTADTASCPVYKCEDRQFREPFRHD
jgi:hypothetical protein